MLTHTTSGWKVILTPRVPSLTATIVPDVFSSLVSSIPELVSTQTTLPAQFEWALHPGGATILSGVEKAMKGLTPEHMRGSYEVYMAHGNSSSATIFSVLKRCMENGWDGVGVDAEDGGKAKDYLLASAFGPGIAVEMAVLKRVGRGLGRRKNGANGNAVSGDSQRDGGGERERSDEDGSASGGSGSLSPVETLVAEDVD
jgi:fungal type III polyketide synthase